MRIGGMEEMRLCTEAGVKNYTVNGACSNCGECCSNLLPMSGREIQTIKRYVKAHGIKENRHDAPTVIPTLDLTCPFRNDAKQRCDIYPVRPFICRDFQCDKQQAGLFANISKYDEDTRGVNVRETFFPRKGKTG